jgi:hypothetical protein
LKSLQFCTIVQDMKRSVETRRKISLSKMMEKNPMWKGDGVGYTGIHQWVARRLKKPILCQRCKVRPAYDLANISQIYKRDLADWIWLCRSCHMETDGRSKSLVLNGDMARIVRGHKARMAKVKRCLKCHLIKNIGDFPLVIRGDLLRRSRCKLCTNIINRERYWNG